MSPPRKTHLAAHAINQLGHGRAGPRALRTQLQSSGSAKPRWRLTLLQKAGVGRTGVTEGDTRIQLSPEGVIGRKATALRSGAERDSGSEACAAWEQELSNAGLAQHPGGTADTTPSPVAVTHPPALTPTRPAFPLGGRPAAAGHRARSFRANRGRYSPSRSQHPPPP